MHDMTPVAAAGRDRRALSWFVRLFCLVLVPAVVIAGPGQQAANAATIYSTPVDYTVHADGSTPGIWGDCSVRLQYSVPDTSGALGVVMGTKCTQGWWLDSGFSGDDVFYSWTLTGTGCSTAATGEVLTEPNTAYSYNMSLGSSSASTCNLNSLCWTAKFALGSGIPDQSDEGCVSISLGAVPRQVTGSCPQGTPSGAFNATAVNNGNGTWTLQATGTVQQAVSPTVGWQFLIWYRQGGAGGTLSTYSFSNLNKTGIAAQSLTSTATGTFGTSPYVIEGVQLILKSNEAGSGPFQNGTYNTALRTTAGPNANMGGVTDPSRCSWYWGNKIASDSATAQDEPYAGLTQTVPPTNTTPQDPPSAPSGSAGCNFKISDPSTWASAGMCAAVQFLSKIVDLLGWIGGLLADLAGAIWGPIVDAISAIASTILDGIEALFVPDPGYFDGKVNSLKSDLRDSKPGAVVDAFDSQSWGVSASGCSGIPVDWSMYGQSFDFDLLEACSGTSATAAGVVKLVASALLVVFGAIACVRSLGSGFGWSPGIGKGVDA